MNNIEDINQVPSFDELVQPPEFIERKLDSKIWFIIFLPYIVIVYGIKAYEYKKGRHILFKEWVLFIGLAIFIPYFLISYIYAFVTDNSLFIITDNLIAFLLVSVYGLNRMHKEGRLKLVFKNLAHDLFYDSVAWLQSLGMFFTGIFAVTVSYMFLPEFITKLASVSSNGFFNSLIIFLYMIIPAILFAFFAIKSYRIIFDEQEDEEKAA